MEMLMLKTIYVVAALLAVFVLVYLGLRVHETLAARRMLATLAKAEAELSPMVFTDTPEYDRGAAALLAQTRFLVHSLNLLKATGKPVLAQRPLVEALADDVACFQDGWDVLASRRGVVLKGYRSDIDGSLRTYSLYVPPNYDGSRGMPMVVSLHGHGWFWPFQGHPAPVMNGAIVLSPEGRGASDYMWIGEEDVLRTIEEVKRDYRIDESRVFITGTSMGGTGAWNVAAHNPHLFAGVGPRAANCDFRAWEARWGWNPPLPGRHDDLRRWLLESDSPVTFLGNLTATPVCVIHNSADAVVPVEHARSAVARLRALGGVVDYREYFVGSHGDFPEHVVPDQLAWLAGHARTQPPAQFRYETRDVRHGRAWYATIEQMDEVMKPATLDVRRDGDRLSIETSNVLAMTVRPAELSGGADEPSRALTLWLDRQAFPSRVARDATPEHFVRAGSLWRLVENRPSASRPGGEAGPRGSDGLRKVRGLEGPVQDVFLEPFVVVVGTGGGETWFKAAEAEAWRFVVVWARRFGSSPSLVPDVGLTEPTVASRNLVFFGRPGENTPMKRILDEMPIVVGDDGAVVAGERFSGEDVGAIFCYPTPGAPGRMTVVYTAASPAALYQVHTRFGNWFNWGVHDSRKWFDYAVYDARTADPETYRVVGFFGTDWSFGRGRAWHPTAQGLARVKPQGVPKFTAPPDDNVLYLSDLRPASIEQMRGAVGFDRSFRGHVITLGALTFDRGLGVRCPSRIEFPLGGKFRTLRATVGFTDECEETLSEARDSGERVHFVVLGDGRVLLTQKVGWVNPVKSVRVDVTGVEKLILAVEGAGGALWLHGSSAWADARVER